MKSDKVLLLKHQSGWTIIVDRSSFPSENYIVFKGDEWNPRRKLPSRGLAYCSSLESALNRLFAQLIIENASQAKKYQGSLQDLRTVIAAAHADFKELLAPKR